jgi:beta-glucosidase
MNETAKIRPDWRHSPEVESRAHALVEGMTLDEKVDLVTGDLNHMFSFYSGAIERVGIPELTMADGPPGLRINNGAVHGGAATALPAPVALAASRSPSLAARYGDVLGHEARASGHNVFLGPAVDIARVPIAGRNFESLGEDPLLAARMAAAEIEAIQKHAVLVCLKRFAVNNQEYERSSIDAEIGEETLHELYLRPFEILVKTTGLASLMGAFNKVNGVHACEHPYLLNDVLRAEWGFKGWVMSDYGATHSTVPSALAGLDQEQPSGVYYAGLLKAAMQQGDVPQETLDEMCRRIVRMLIGLGVIDRPLEIRPLEAEAHRLVAEAVAEEGTVLLQNNSGLLPADPAKMRRVAVIGVDADSVAAAGGGSGKVRPAHAVSLLDGIRRRLGAGVAVDYAQGSDPVSAADLLPGAESIPSSFLRVENEETHGLKAEFWTNQDFFGEPFAVRTMPQVALNFGFFNFPGFGANSTRYPDFPSELNGRISVRFTGRLTVPKGGSYRLSLAELGTVRVFLDEKLVLDFRYHGPGRTGGGAGGSGFAGVRNLDDDVRVPSSSDRIAAAFGHRAAELDLTRMELAAPGTSTVRRTIAPCFPWATALATRRSPILKSRFTAETMERDGRFQTPVLITNVGGETAEEVAQMYVCDLVGSVTRPVRELKAFRRISLAPGESRRVEFALEARDLVFCDIDLRLSVEPGEFRLWIGPNAVEGPNAVFEVV